MDIFQLLQVQVAQTARPADMHFGQARARSVPLENFRVTRLLSVMIVTQGDIQQLALPNVRFAQRTHTAVVARNVLIVQTEKLATKAPPHVTISWKTQQQNREQRQRQCL